MWREVEKTNLYQECDLNKTQKSMFDFKDPIEQ